jgi:hypothetical protein
MAKTAVKEQLRAQGLRPTRMRAVEIEALAREYLAAHPELKLHAFERAKRMRLIDPSDEDILKLALLTSEPKERDIPKEVFQYPTDVNPPMPIPGMKEQTPNWRRWLMRLLQRILRR